MSRGKQGKKSGRVAKHRALKAAMKERKRLRRQRREERGVLTLKERPLIEAVDVVQSVSDGVAWSCPTLKEWEEMQARAKSRRRNFQKFAEHNGWRLDGEDPKQKDDWEIER